MAEFGEWTETCAQEPEGGAEARQDAKAFRIIHVKTTDAPKGFKVNPLFVETKSRRMQLLVQPSLYYAIKARATAEEQSMNELIHSILEAAIKGDY